MDLNFFALFVLEKLHLDINTVAVGMKPTALLRALMFLSAFVSTPSKTNIITDTSILLVISGQ